MMPYGYQEEWYHDPLNTNMTYVNQITIPSMPPLTSLPPPPYPSTGIPNSSWWAVGTTITQTQMEAWITAINSPWGSWTNLYATLLNPNPPTPQPSHVLMANHTAYFDYENQSSICEWCADWISPTGGNSVPGTFNPQVLNWPLWLQNPTWTVTEAENMCDCCPATPPLGGIAALSYPPQNGAVVAEWVMG
jgi:hypothetical protein